MRPAISAVVSYYDLQNYFTGSSWDFKRQDDGTVTAKSEAYDVQVKQKSSKYELQMSATDDPYDSETVISDNPVQAITKFLSTGEGSDEILKKMSSMSSPEKSLLPALLRRMAVGLESGALEQGRAARILRRAAVAGNEVQRFFVAIVEAVSGAGDDSKEVAKITKEMKEKGWKVTQSEEDGRPVLNVDVSGIYSVEIRVTDTVWDYSFQVNGIEESKESGTTDDPIQQFRLYYKKDSTQDFKKELKARKEEQPKDDGTVAPGKKGPQPKKDPSAPAKKDSPSGTEDTMLAPTKLPPSGRTDSIPRSNKHSDDERPTPL